jgi:hypothetical protein
MLQEGNLNEFLEVLMLFIEGNAYLHFSKEHSNNDVLQQMMHEVVVMLDFPESFLTLH